MPSKSLKSWSSAPHELAPPQKATPLPAEPLASMLTPRQASEYLQVPVSTLAVWRCTGRVTLPYLKVGTRQVRYRQEDIEAFLSRSHPAKQMESSGKAAAEPPQVARPVTSPKVGSIAYWRASHLARRGKFECESCSRTLQEFEALIATCLDAPISDPHDSHCFCANCHRELMKLTRPARPASLLSIV